MYCEGSFTPSHFCSRPAQNQWRNMSPFSDRTSDAPDLTKHPETAGLHGGIGFQEYIHIMHSLCWQHKIVIIDTCGSPRNLMFPMIVALQRISAFEVLNLSRSLSLSYAIGFF